MVTVLLPTSSGMLAAVHIRVPVAVPEAPVDVDHATELTPTLSEAIPWKVIVPALVETMVDAGFVMVSEGGVVSRGAPGVEGEPGPDGALGEDGLDGALGDVGVPGAGVPDDDGVPGEDGVLGVEGVAGLLGVVAGCWVTEIVCVTM